MIDAAELAALFAAVGLEPGQLSEDARVFMVSDLERRVNGALRMVERAGAAPEPLERFGAYGAADLDGDAVDTPSTHAPVRHPLLDARTGGDGARLRVPKKARG